VSKLTLLYECRMNAYMKGKKYVSSDYVASMSDVDRRSRGNKTETRHKE